jgi:hypothetical protein
MGNMAEAGFGDTRLPSEEGEEDYNPSLVDSIDANAYTYRNGVNYRKVSSNLMTEYSANIPRSIQNKYMQ